jgi:hypothetical protein
VTGPLLIDRAQDHLQHAIRVSHHVVIPESQNEVTHGFEHVRSVCVAFSILIMLSAIDFHDELPVGTEEVDDKSVDRYLSLEFPSPKPAITQAKPQHALGISLFATQAPGELCGSFHDPNRLA